MFQVVYKPPAADWKMQGGVDDPDSDRVVPEDDPDKFFYQKWYVLLKFKFSLSCDVRCCSDRRKLFILGITSNLPDLKIHQLKLRTTMKMTSLFVPVASAARRHLTYVVVYVFTQRFKEFPWKRNVYDCS